MRQPITAATVTPEIGLLAAGVSGATALKANNTPAASNWIEVEKISGVPLAENVAVNSATALNARRVANINEMVAPRRPKMSMVPAVNTHSPMASLVASTFPFSMPRVIALIQVGRAAVPRKIKRHVMAIRIPIAVIRMP
jgi:hypothetical protein